MPERTWKCSKCGEKNPPYTEVCRSCFSEAPAVLPIEEQKLDRKLPEPAPFFQIPKPASLPPQTTFSFDPRLQGYGAFTFVVTLVLALMFFRLGYEAFEYGQVYHRGKLQWSGTSAYLEGLFRITIGCVAPLSFIAGPRWFYLLRAMLIALAVLFQISAYVAKYA